MSGHIGGEETLFVTLLPALGTTRCCSVLINLCARTGACGYVCICRCWPDTDLTPSSVRSFTDRQGFVINLPARDITLCTLQRLRVRCLCVLSFVANLQKYQRNTKRYMHADTVVVPYGQSKLPSLSEPPTVCLKRN